MYSTLAVPKDMVPSGSGSNGQARPDDTIFTPVDQQILEVEQLLRTLATVSSRLHTCPPLFRQDGRARATASQS